MSSDRGGGVWRLLCWERVLVLDRVTIASIFRLWNRNGVWVEYGRKVRSSYTSLGAYAHTLGKVCNCCSLILPQFREFEIHSNNTIHPSNTHKILKDCAKSESATRWVVKSIISQFRYPLSRLRTSHNFSIQPEFG